MALNWVVKCIQKPSRVPGCDQDAAGWRAPRRSDIARPAQVPGVRGVVDDDGHRHGHDDPDRGGDQVGVGPAQVAQRPRHRDRGPDRAELAQGAGQLR